MKLLSYTYRKLSILLFLLMGIWGVFFYYTILDEVIDETDDSLENYRDILVQSALNDSTVLNTGGSIMTPYTFRPISVEEATGYKEIFFDSTTYIEVEDEFEPVRVMKTCFKMPGGQYYELELMVSTLEREDMIEAIGGYLLTLYILLLLCIIVGNHFILKKAFRPLQRLMDWLDRVQPGREVPPLDNETEIHEFSRLNEAAVAMSNRSYKAYIGQKQFIENASHELQTPLAILRGKIELLAEDESLTEAQMKILEDIYNSLDRAVKLNRSLLLLSRIENKQYADSGNVVVNHIVDTVLPDLMTIYEAKNIELTRHDEGEFIIHCNPALAQTLVSNLLKNALTHNIKNGQLHVRIGKNELSVKNSGTAPLDGDKIFQRFYRSQNEKKDSTGLGLAIAKSVADSYKLSLYYTWEDGMHCFTLK